MVSVYPAAAIFIPCLLYTVHSRRRSVLYFLLSIPLFDITVAHAVSHPFIVPEVAFFGLLGNQVIRWSRDERAEVPWSRAHTWFSIFLAIGAISLIYVAENPASVLVNPYGSYAGNFDWIPLTLSLSNITQLVLRVFPVIVIMIFSWSIDISEIPHAIRTLVIGGVIVGCTGVFYQISVLAGWSFVPQAGLWFGGMWRPLGEYGFLGPVPRMGTISGEPGHTAQFLLYLLAVTTTLHLTGSNRVFRERTQFALVMILGGFLLLTTSMTAYGGLIVLAVVTATLGIVTGAYVPRRVLRLTSWAAVLFLGLLSLMIVTQGDSLIRYQLEKLQFQGGSGSYRARYFVRSLEVAAKRPLFGVGVGSYYPLSLFGILLAETGVLGLVSFLAAVTTSSRSALGLHLNANLRMPDLTLALVNGAMTMVLVSLVAKSITTILSPWFWVAIALPIVVVQFERGASHSGETSRTS